MKTFLAAFLALLLAGSVLLGVSRWITRWETAAAVQTKDLTEARAYLRQWMYRLPDEEAAHRVYSQLKMLEFTIPKATRHLINAPPTADGTALISALGNIEPDLKYAKEEISAWRKAHGVRE